jgi:histone H3/H4
LVEAQNPTQGVKPTTELKVVAKKGRKASSKSMAIPYACMKRLAADKSGGMRISSDTVFVLEKATEQIIEKIINLSKSYTEARGRKTLTAKDVEAALKNFSM